MSRRVLALSLAALLAAAAWGAWTIAEQRAARRANERAKELYVQIAEISRKRLEAERQRDDLRTALLEARVELEASDRHLAEQTASHRQVVARIERRLREAGQQLEAARFSTSDEEPSSESVAKSRNLRLGLEPPDSLQLEEAWAGWRSCEQTLAAALEAHDDCQSTLAAQESVLEAGERIEQQLRDEIAARQELERQLRRAARRRKVAGRLKLLGAALAGYGAAQLLD